jgi:hypothetical protein
MRALLIMMLVAVLHFSCAPGSAQVRGKPDMSPAEQHAKIPPLPPKNVTVQRTVDGVKVSWDPVPLERIIGYRIYRKIGSALVPLGLLRKPPFIDEHVPISGDLAYTVTSIDDLNRESSYAKSAVLERCAVGPD